MHIGRGQVLSKVAYDTISQRCTLNKLIRHLSIHLFRAKLLTHTKTGRPSNAARNKSVKPKGAFNSKKLLAIYGKYNKESYAENFLYT